MLNPQGALAILGLSFFAVSAFAKEVRLFDRSGAPISEYNQTVESLQRGDELLFNDGKKFKFIELAGRGNSSYVLRVEGRIVLRIPYFLPSLTGHPGDHWEKFLKMEEFLTGMSLLSTTDIPIASMNFEKRGAEYQATEDLEIAFRLDEFLFALGLLRPDAADPEARRRWSGVPVPLAIPPFLTKTYLSKLEEFLGRSWEVTAVSDFRASQVGWSKKYKDWRLMDATNSVAFFIDEKDSSLLDELISSWNLEPEWAARVRSKIQARRAQAGQGGRACWILF